MNVFTDERVTLDMPRATWHRLIHALGIAAGTVARENDQTSFYRHLALVNELNEGNPNWTPYEIPEIAKAAPAKSLDERIAAAEAEAAAIRAMPKGKP